ncbi:homoserine O-acetyltransferase, partial [Aureobasidium melanogenum]
TPDPSRKQNINGSFRPSTPSSDHFAIHNEGHKHAGSPRYSRVNSSADLSTSTESLPAANTPPQTIMDPQFHGTTPLPTNAAPPNLRLKRTPTYFSAQSYLRYQGEKFIKRFDANCYIAITRKLDTHDVSRGRLPADSQTTTPVADALAQIEQPTLVLGIQSDGLFTYAEQKELAAAIPNAVLKNIDSPEGHDAFLLEFEQVNRFVLDFLHEVLPDMMAREPVDFSNTDGVEGDQAVKTSTFGEAEVGDITAW